MRTFSFQMQEKEFAMCESLLNDLEIHSISLLVIRGLETLSAMTEASRYGFDMPAMINSKEQKMVRIPGEFNVPVRTSDDSDIIPFTPKKKS